jgi:hypothetical protein
MKRLIQTGIVFGLALIVWQVSADARFLDLKKQEQPTTSLTLEPSPSQNINPTEPLYRSQVEPHGISLQFENLPLLDVLKNIQAETGILISIDPSLEELPVNLSIHADNWEGAIKNLLKRFNRVEVWTDNLKTSRVWLLSQAEINPVDFKLQKRLAPRPKPIKITNSKNTNGVVDKAFSQLPTHIQNDPEVLRYLYSKKVRLPKSITAKFGVNMKHLPPQRPMYSHVKNNLKFKRYLISTGLPLPTS